MNALIERKAFAKTQFCRSDAHKERLRIMQEHCQAIEAGDHGLADAWLKKLQRTYPHFATQAI